MEEQQKGTMSSSTARKCERTHDSADDRATQNRKISIEGARCQQKMVELWRAGSLCDVTVLVDNEKFPAHRIVLAAGSDYMRALFCEDRFEDSSKTSIELPGMEAGPFRVVLEWLYEKQCELDESMATKVLEVACRLQCVELIPTLEKKIGSTIMPETCLEMWDFAERMQLAKLAESATDKAAECYETLTGSAAFKALPAIRLSALLASDALKVKEEDVFTSVISWAKAQSEPPTADTLGELFEHVRFACMPNDFIIKNVESEEFLLGNRRGVLSLVQGLREKAHNIKSSRTSPRFQAELSIDDFQDGFRFRIKKTVEDIPGLAWDPAMAEWIGRTVTFRYRVHSVDERYQEIKINEFWWPFKALERA